MVFKCHISLTLCLKITFFLDFLFGIINIFFRKGIKLRRVESMAKQSQVGKQLDVASILARRVAFQHSG